MIQLGRLAGLRRDRGQSLAEYGLILALVAVVGMGGAGMLGQSLSDQFEGLAGSIGSVVTGGGGAAIAAVPSGGGGAAATGGGAATGGEPGGGITIDQLAPVMPIDNNGGGTTPTAPIQDNTGTTHTGSVGDDSSSTPATVTEAPHGEYTASNDNYSGQDTTSGSTWGCGGGDCDHNGVVSDYF